MAKRDIFVGRDEELARLESTLQIALAGEGQICFLSGEPGSGKTRLVTEFTRRAEQTHRELVTALGQCDAQTGLGDAYLPFREVLDMLTGDVDTELERGTITRENAGRLRAIVSTSAEVLLDLGPDLLGLFIPIGGLLVRLGAFAAEKTGLKDRLTRRSGSGRESKASGAEGIDQSQIFEQYVNVLSALSSAHPLLIVLDDLQWADASSIELLFRLGRRLDGTGLMVIGTYRPDELARGRAGGAHPLEKVLTELSRYHGDVVIDLDQAQDTSGRQFVDALLDREANLLDEGFRATLYRHTGGNALFTVELVREMQQRGDILRDEGGRWVQGTALDWALLPPRVEGVIRERLLRLEEEARQSLTVGSVEGTEFTAEVVAEVREVAPRTLIGLLSKELDRGQRVIESQGTRRLGRQRLSRYAFENHLFQRYLYSTLDNIERAYLHEDVGIALEALHGDAADEIAVELARHFVEAELMDKAQKYLQTSGERAALRYAHEEATQYLTRALELAPAEAYAERYSILLTREQVFHMRGDRDAQLKDLTELRALAEGLEDSSKKTQVALLDARYAEMVSAYARAVEGAQTAIRLAQATGDHEGAAKGYLQAGRAAWHQGDFASARSHLEQARTLAQEADLRIIEGDSLNNLGIVSWYQGDFEQAKDYLQRALRIKEQVGDRLGLGHILMNLAAVLCEQGSYTEAIAQQRKALDLYHSTGYRRGEGMALCNLSGFLLYQGEYDRAKARLLECLPIHLEMGDQESVIASHINLGILSVYLGKHDEAEGHLENALTLSREIGDWRGELEAVIYSSLLQHHRGDDKTARARADRAVALARKSQDSRNLGHALTLLGHALVGLGHLGGAAEAYEEAVALRRESGERHRAMESLAGLARVSLALARPAEALDQVDEILEYLGENSLDGTDEPFRVYLTCYDTLRANGDDRAEEVLLRARKMIEDRARHIDDPDLRRSFLECVPAHRELAQQWQDTGAAPQPAS